MAATTKPELRELLQRVDDARDELLQVYAALHALRRHGKHETACVNNAVEELWQARETIADALAEEIDPRQADRRRLAVLAGLAKHR